MAKLVSRRYLGKMPVYDLTVAKHHNFIANGVVVHNCMNISKVLAGFTGPEANKLRKAIGKKLEDLMAEMKKKFIKGAKARVDAGEITDEEVLEVWNTLESFAGYGFNKSVDRDTEVITLDGVRRIEDVQAGQKVWCFDGDGFVETDVVALHDHGVLPAFEFVFDDGSKETCTLNHKFLTQYGQIPIFDIVEFDYEVYAEQEGFLTQQQILTQDSQYRLDSGCVAHSVDEFARESDTGGVSLRKVLHTRFVGLRQMYDLEVSHSSHNFVLASGLITSNSHAVAYSAITTAQLWLKYYYPLEYITALANNTKQGKKKTSIGVANLLVHYLNYGRKRGFEILPPCVNKSESEFTIQNGGIRFSLDHIKNVASNSSKISEIAPYDSMADFYDRCVYKQVIKTGKNAGKMRSTRPNKKVVESLIASGAFDSMANEGKTTAEKRNSLMQEYCAAKKEKKEPARLTSRQWREKEVEVIGLCLSEPPLLKAWAETIESKKWDTIESSAKKKRSMVFGQIMACRAHTSKKGNSMHIVTLSDGIDSIDFFVFEGGRQLFFETYKTGNIVAIPLSKFEDGDAKFFNEYEDGVVIAK